MQLNFNQAWATGMSPLRRNGDIPVADADHQTVLPVSLVISFRLHGYGLAPFRSDPGSEKSVFSAPLRLERSGRESWAVGLAKQSVIFN